MAFAGTRQEILDAAYAEFGDEASWRVSGGGAGIPCTVRRRDPDQVAGSGDTEITVESVLIRVRTSEIAEPAAEDTVQIGTDLYRIFGQPQAKAHRLEWTCEATWLEP